MRTQLNIHWSKSQWIIARQDWLFTFNICNANMWVYSSLCITNTTHLETDFKVNFSKFQRSNSNTQLLWKVDSKLLFYIRNKNNPRQAMGSIKSKYPYSNIKCSQWTSCEISWHLAQNNLIHTCMKIAIGLQTKVKYIR